MARASTSDPKSNTVWFNRLSYSLTATCLVLCACLLRLCVGFQPYSGMHNPPQYGDYEAQRHWMEVTVNLPAADWYRNTPDNNLTYWGLDYPPLSAYQSWLFGWVFKQVDPSTVELIASQGHETPFSKVMMRWTVLASDVACYFPAAFAAACLHGKNKASRLVVLALMLFNPALIIIDHGHFQYNCISLGLAGCAMAAAALGHYMTGSVLFCLSLNHKQMSLYYAPAFFTFLLGISLKQRGFLNKVACLLSIGVAVCVTFALMWLPFLGSLDSTLGVAQRIFPTKRGLFEDYVANFWCVSSLVLKWKRHFDPSQLLKFCTISTLACFLPAVTSQAFKPSKWGFIMSCLISSFSFFLLSYQVHEKSILLPLLPLSMMANSNIDMVTCVVYTSLFSMYPLLKKDQLSVAYGALLVLTYCMLGLLRLGSAAGSKRKWAMDYFQNKALVSWFVLAATAVHVCLVVLPPPERYPYIFDAAIVSLAFAVFCATLLSANIWQYLESKSK